MAKLTEEQKAQRARTRRRNQALAAEAEHRRTEARHREWDRKGLRLTRAELEAGVPCRGCGLPIVDDLEPFPPLMHLTDAQRVEYDAAEKEYLQRHGDCHANRWSMGGSRTTHCGYCCPPPTLSERQIADVSRIMSGWKNPDPRELDAWELLLTCEHSVRHQMHKSNTYWSRSVLGCPTCGEARGVVESARLPAPDDEAVENEEQRQKALKEAERELAKLRREAKSVEKRINALADADPGD